MKKKNNLWLVGVFLVASILLVNIVSASTSLMTVDTRIKTQYVESEDKIYVELQGRTIGGDLTWSTRYSHSNASSGQFNEQAASFIYQLNETKWCVGSQSMITQHNQMLDGMSSLVNVCNSAMQQYNTSTTQLMALSESNQKMLEYESLWQVEKSKRELLDTINAQCQEELTRIRRERDQLSNADALATQRLADLTRCQEELEEAEKDKTNRLLLGIGIGAGAGYFFWGRKKEKGTYQDMPSEMEEAYDY